MKGKNKKNKVYGVESTSDRWIKENQVFEDRVFEDRVINEGTSDEKVDEKISTFATNAIG
jgi:hypothetical protein